MQMTEKHNAKENDNKKSVQKIKISFQPNDECVYGDIYNVSFLLSWSVIITKEQHKRIDKYNNLLIFITTVSCYNSPFIQIT